MMVGCCGWKRRWLVGFFFSVLWQFFVVVFFFFNELFILFYEVLKNRIFNIGCIIK